MDAANNSTVLVTGGRGFIGRALAKLLQRESHGVVSLDVDGVETTDGLREVGCDISDRKELRRLSERTRIGTIIHLAAVLPTAAQHDPVRATEVNVAGSSNLLELAREFGVRRFVFGSSLSVYGSYPADQVVSEDLRAGPEDLYGASKLYVEQLGAAYRQRFGLEFVSLRIGRVVGAGAQSKTSAWRSEVFELLRTRHASEITVPYRNSERLLLVHVDDVARALIELVKADGPAHALYNAPCESVTVGDLKREVEKLNSNIRVAVADAGAKGNPRVVDWSRFRREFGMEVEAVFGRMAREAGGDAR